MKTKFKAIFVSLVSILMFSAIAGANPAKTSIDNPLNSTSLLQQEQDKWGNDSATCVMNLSLYREFYKQWRASGYKNTAVNDAIGPWRWVFNNCPLASQNTYIDGINMMEYFMKKNKTDEVKEQYIDTMMMIYDQRIKYFGREGYILGRKGSDLFKYAPEDYEKAYHIFKKSVDLRGNKSESFVLVYYFRTVSKMVDDEKLDKFVIVDTYDKISEIIDYNLEANKNDPKASEAWENVKGNIELSFEPYATCEDLIAIYSNKFNETPDDVELLKKITDMLDKKGCTESQLFFDASVKLNELNPSPNSSYMIAKMLVKKEQYDEAIPYLEDALNIEDDETRADVYLLLSSVYRQKGSFSTARKYARQAIDLRPSEGHAYLIIGDMYASSADQCGDNDLSKKAAYWVAVDMYQKARQVDPEVADIAQKRIEVYSQQFPKTETVFFYDLKEGDPYTVECWINERTTVRTYK
ncbi:MAG: tetratricopeptide repeat protein [Bacteroidales bacterium]